MKVKEGNLPTLSALALACVLKIHLSFFFSEKKNILTLISEAIFILDLNGRFLKKNIYTPNPTIYNIMIYTVKGQMLK